MLMFEQIFVLQYVKRLKAPIENILEVELRKGNKGKNKTNRHPIIYHMTHHICHTTKLTKACVKHYIST